MDIKTDTSPKEIIVFAMTELAEFLKPDGFQFYKSKLEIRKRSDFTFSISTQLNRNNQAGETVQAILSCSIFDKEGKECFWSKGIPKSNRNQDFLTWWDFCGNESYEHSIEKIKELISHHFYLLSEEWSLNWNLLYRKLQRRDFVYFRTKLYMTQDS